jgi:uncharacterized protein YbjT (DUF2867 family)
MAAYYVLCLAANSPTARARRRVEVVVVVAAAAYCVLRHRGILAGARRGAAAIILQYCSME